MWTPRIPVDALLRTQQHFPNKDDLILRDHLALVRTRLANERTLLSYVRSSLYLLIGGIALIKVEGYGDLKWAGYVSLFLCVASVIVGLFRFWTLRRQLDRYYDPLDSSQLPPLQGGSPSEDPARS